MYSIQGRRRTYGKSFSTLMIAILIATQFATLTGPSVAQAIQGDSCGEVFVYTKTNDFSDTRITINFEDQGNQDNRKIDVSAKTGYVITKVELDVDNDGHNGYFTYATGPVNNYNPNPGDEINSAKITTKKSCPDVCANIAGDQYSVPEGMVQQGNNCVNEPKVDVCHNENILNVNQSAVQSHINHGDFVIDAQHPCPPLPVDVCPNVIGDQAAGPCADELCAAPYTWVSESSQCSPPACPEGTAGTYPDCTPIAPEACPEGTVGVPPTCEPITPESCPVGFTGVQPDCVPIPPVETCPEGTVGIFPACDPVVPPPVCPEGTTGVFPACQPIVPPSCPEGTSGTYPDCVEIPQTCPVGTVGTYPECVTPEPEVCPVGTTGEYPNCESTQNEEHDEDPAPATPTTTNNGGGSNGPIAGSLAPIGQVLGASTSINAIVENNSSCSPIITSFLKMGAKNDPDQIKALQAFLNKNLGISLEVNGEFDQATFDAVKEFQTKYSKEVLSPWGISRATGFVYKTTSRWINMLACSSLVIPMPELN